ncbi:hypothetical protein U3516DRAFT_763994 [Neocallimastix sp. 'constans']
MVYSLLMKLVFLITVGELNCSKDAIKYDNERVIETIEKSHVFVFLLPSLNVVDVSKIIFQVFRNSEVFGF